MQHGQNLHHRVIRRLRVWPDQDLRSRRETAPEFGDEGPNVHGPCVESKPGVSADGNNGHRLGIDPGGALEQGTAKDTSGDEPNQLASRCHAGIIYIRHVAHYPDCDRTLTPASESGNSL